MSSATPDGLSDRGRATWLALHRDRTPSPTEDLLVLEACRLVGRLDLMDAALRAGFNTETATEARLTAGALKAIVAEIRQFGAESTGGGVSALDELAARRSAGRSTGSPGS